MYMLASNSNIHFVVASFVHGIFELTSNAAVAAVAAATTPAENLISTLQKMAI